MTTQRHLAQGTLVIGLGNLYRGDDAAGLAAAQHLREVAPPELEIIEHSGDPLVLLDALAAAERVIVVDAVQSGAHPGTVHRLEVGDQPLSAAVATASTHSVGLAELIELARTLGKLPSRVTIYGVEAVQYTPGTEPTPECAAAVTGVVTAILEEVGEVALCTS
ncbi:MAG: hydrogenase maturation protease [Dehalococcoidia bacterium]|nr:hydrogenase maturation protease [Dehalococcoidia bacterium]